MELTPEQIAMHRTHIGGSAAAMACGMSARGTARELYEFMRNGVDLGFSATEAAWLGSSMEEPVLHRYAWHLARSEGKRVPAKIQFPRKTRHHRRHAWAIAHGDALVQGHPIVVEAKVRRSMEGWGAPGSDDVPSEIWCQAVHLMGCYGRSVCHVPVYFTDALTFQCYEIQRDREAEEAVFALEEEFMQRVADGTPPPFDFQHPSTPDLVKRLYPGTNGRHFEPDDATAAVLQSYVEVWQDAKERAKEAGQLADMAKARVLAAMEEHAVFVLPNGGRVARKLSSRGSYRAEATTWVSARYVKPKG